MNADLPSAYLRTELSIALPNRGWVAVAEVIGSFSSPLYILTAWNPAEERPSAEANREQNRLLRQRLAALGEEVHPAIGASPDGDHFEESYAVTGLDRSTALALGREFQQVAIFEVLPSQQTVLACDGSWESKRVLPLHA